MPTQPIATLSERQTLSEQVYNDIKEAIIAGELIQGAKITEDELAKKYGISRGPLREALRRLESIRLLIKIPHAGMRVVTLTPEMIEEIYIVREALEGMSARLAAERMTDEEIEDLRNLLVRHSSNIDKSDGKQYFQREGDLDFHFRIAQASNNQWLMDLLSSELYQLLRMCRHRTSQAPARPTKALTEHKQIVEAIASRDAELAEMLMRRHISGAWKTVEILLKEELSEGALQNDTVTKQ
ncbi:MULTISPECIES: GntR family transcriptional regulator [Cocleimonas]|jgi:DNA-binding GntR family transcriptional regulator|uniref:DNA-binding GntR family transcriptional regulator n=1 Tax=Cocleimonas flava TaxID=634765 RepID=A0A4R1EX18_9GAMM|nr:MULTISPECIES: GntR family transcriptional regulator [Cocleimonas]MEB8434263.1 GntR family transcriptional regulator [Cocleimonas sp. KMM 6892]MEC4717118.1 GntR family transcriptional regulator [Cocleimonas sp. KMM 6895]MEC4746535.1 GntR family transcriptional regulator [Cocleimonas sp. KMM 6896]TCJ84514.1 DNA-binding GntR family transcriptional regulator [Cocleimonas flava]